VRREVSSYDLVNEAHDCQLLRQQLQHAREGQGPKEAPNSTQSSDEMPSHECVEVKCGAFFAY